MVLAMNISALMLLVLPLAVYASTPNIPRGCRQERFSTYATGRALLEPARPSHRWHRTIRRDLAPEQVVHTCAVSES